MINLFIYIFHSLTLLYVSVLDCWSQKILLEWLEPDGHRHDILHAAVLLDVGTALLHPVENQQRNRLARQVFSKRPVYVWDSHEFLSAGVLVPNHQVSWVAAVVLGKDDRGLLFFKNGGSHFTKCIIAILDSSLTLR